jgi:hypothetical protein
MYIGIQALLDGYDTVCSTHRTPAFTNTQFGTKVDNKPTCTVITTINHLTASYVVLHPVLDPVHFLKLMINV